MATTVTPTADGAHSGLIGDASSIAGSAQLNQFLGTHTDSVIYQGSSILTPDGVGVLPWNLELSTQDVDQPFTMSGTSIGRVLLPLLAVGNGADLVVSLCSDNGSGQPGLVIAQTRLPASWTTQLSAYTATSGASSASPNIQVTSNPLAVAQFNTVQFNEYWQEIGWNSLSSSATGVVHTANVVTAGNYMLLIGGIIRYQFTNTRQ